MPKRWNSNYGLILFNQDIGPLSGTTTPGQSEPGSDGNEGLLGISQSTIIIGASQSDCLVAYPGYPLVGGLPLCRETVGIFYSPRWLGNFR